MGDILDFKKFRDAKKQFRSDIDHLYEQGKTLKFIEQYTNSQGKEIIKIVEGGRRIILRLLVQIFKELITRNPQHTWPQTKEEFDWRLAQFGSSVINDVGGPMLFLLDMMYCKVITKDGSIDMEEFCKRSPKKDT